MKSQPTIRSRPSNDAGPEQSMGKRFEREEAGIPAAIEALKHFRWATDGRIHYGHRSSRAFFRIDRTIYGWGARVAGPSI
jgi:hypothetical protein